MRGPVLPFPVPHPLPRGMRANCLFGYIYPPQMARTTGAVVLIVLAISVACLGVFLAVRCERTKVAPVDTLIVESGR